VETIQSILGRQPVAILSAIGAFVALLVAFGVDISTGQKAAIVAFVAAVLELFKWATVTPVIDPRLPQTPGGGV
jgi:ABC-type glucose/galactose transport system permease subunit